jgi:hypothetical protein
MCSWAVKIELLSLKLSLVTDLAPLTPHASENVDLHHSSEFLGLNIQSLQGDKGNPLDSPDRANMNGCGPSSQGIISQQAARFSNSTPQGPRSLSLFHIPSQLITRILLYLSPHDIISCRCACRMFHELCSHPHLRYPFRWNGAQ